MYVYETKYEIVQDEQYEELYNIVAVLYCNEVEEYRRKLDRSLGFQPESLEKLRDTIDVFLKETNYEAYTEGEFTITWRILDGRIREN